MADPRAVDRPLPRVLLYSRSGCHLCEDARSALQAAGVAFDEVDITRDPALEAEYRILIPVVMRGGRQVFEAGMDPAQLPRLLQR